MNNEKIEEQRAAMPSKYRKLYDKVLIGKASPREAIKLQCLECYGYIQAETETCDNYLCHLYHYRPYQKSVKSPTGAVQQSNIDELSEEGS